jgi:hypothetical protein
MVVVGRLELLPQSKTTQRSQVSRANLEERE